MPRRSRRQSLSKGRERRRLRKRNTSRKRRRWFGSRRKSSSRGRRGSRLRRQAGMIMPFSSIKTRTTEARDIGRSNRAAIRQLDGQTDPLLYVDYSLPDGITDRDKIYEDMLNSAVSVLTTPTRRLKDFEAAVLAHWREPVIEKNKNNPKTLTPEEHRILDLIYGVRNSAKHLYKKAVKRGETDHHGEWTL